MSLLPIVAAALLLQACFAHADNASLEAQLDARLSPMFKSGAPIRGREVSQALEKKNGNAATVV